MTNSRRINLKAMQASFVGIEFSTVISYQQQGIHKDQMQSENVDLFPETKPTTAVNSLVSDKYTVFTIIYNIPTVFCMP